MEESIIEKAIVGIRFGRNRQSEHGDVTTCSRDYGDYVVGSGLQHVEKPRSSRELPHFLRVLCVAGNTRSAIRGTSSPAKIKNVLGIPMMEKSDAI